MSRNLLIFNNTVLRDGHQSLAATRMRTAQMLPALEDLDTLGFGALETWGGATIDSGLRFLGEFPFDRLDALKRGAHRTPHMMLLRGQNIVQYANFPDDVVASFVRTAAKHGMDIFRIFDALNDMRNIGTAVRAVKDAGKHAQGTICYTSSPVHTNETFIDLARELVELDCDSICLKDMAGLIPPRRAFEIIRGIRRNFDTPVTIHTHETAGLGAPTYYAAIEAGVDAVDTSIVPFANGTGQPDTLRMMSILEDDPRAPSFDLVKLQRLREHFTKVYGELSEFTSPRNEVVDTEALQYQVPGGMLSNFRTQLKEQRMEDRFDEVFAEIPVVREALGWIPLVTPTSQIVGVQAMLNVKFGRWKNFTPPAIDIALGYYGRTPAPVNPEVRARAAKEGRKEPITDRPADLLTPRMEELRRTLQEKRLPNDDEHCVIYAMYPQELEKHYATREESSPTGKVASGAASKPVSNPGPGRAADSSGGRPDRRGSVTPSRMRIAVEGRYYDVRVEEVT